MRSLSISAALGLLVLIAGTGCSVDPIAPPFPAKSAGQPSAQSSVVATTNGPTSHTVTGHSPAAQSPTVQAFPHVLATRARWSLPMALSREVVIDQGNSGVIAGGLLPGDVSSRLTFSVSGGQGVIRRLAPLAEPLHDSSGVSVGGRPVVVGGGGSTELSAVERYADGRWHVSGHLPGARSDLSVVSVASGFLVVGGYDGSTSPRQVLMSHDGRSFTVFAQLPRGVRYAAVVSSGRAVWLFGGEGKDRELRSVQRIDTHSGAVNTVGELPTALGHAAVAVLGSRILLMGGRTAPHQVTDQMWWFDPVTHQFSAASRLPYPVADAGVLTSGDGVYLLGGETPDFTQQVIHVQLAP